jgi:hypothetical protein
MHYGCVVASLMRCNQAHRWALRRLTPVKMRSTRQVLVAICFAAREGLMPRRATMVQICTAYSEGGRTLRPNMRCPCTLAGREGT